MGSNKGQSAVYCVCCKTCKEGTDFFKILDDQEAGVTVYRRIPQIVNILSDEKTKSRITDINLFIVHNTSDIPISSDTFVALLGKQKFNCLRCRKIIEHVQKLFNQIPTTISKKDVVCICDHCNTRKQLNKQCDACAIAIKKFFNSKSKKNETTCSKTKTLLSDIQNALKIEETTKEVVAKTSEIHLISRREKAIKGNHPYDYESQKKEANVTSSASNLLETDKIRKGQILSVEKKTAQYSDEFKCSDKKYEVSGHRDIIDKHPFTNSKEYILTSNEISGTKQIALPGSSGFDYSSEEQISKSFASLIYVSNKKEIKRLLTKTDISIAKKSVYQLPLDKSTEHFHTQKVPTPILDNLGYYITEKEHATSSIIDISESKRAADQLTVKMELMEKRQKHKGSTSTLDVQDMSTLKKRPLKLETASDSETLNEDRLKSIKSKRHSDAPFDSSLRNRSYHSEEAISGSLSVTLTQRGLKTDFNYFFPYLQKDLKKDPNFQQTSSELIQQTRDTLKQRADEENLKRTEKLKKQELENEKKRLLLETKRKMKEDKRQTISEKQLSTEEESNKKLTEEKIIVKNTSDDQDIRKSLGENDKEKKLFKEKTKLSMKKTEILKIDMESKPPSIKKKQDETPIKEKKMNEVKTVDDKVKQKEKNEEKLQKDPEFNSKNVGHEDIKTLKGEERFKKVKKENVQDIETDQVDKKNIQKQEGLNSINTEQAKNIKKYIEEERLKKLDKEETQNVEMDQVDKENIKKVDSRKVSIQANNNKLKQQDDKKAKVEEQIEKLIESKHTIQKPVSIKSERAEVVKELDIKRIKVNKPSVGDVTQLVNIKPQIRVKPQCLSDLNITEKQVKQHHGHKAILDSCPICIDSDLELDVENIMFKGKKGNEMDEIIINRKIFKYRPSLRKSNKEVHSEILPLLFRTTHRDEPQSENMKEKIDTVTNNTAIENQAKSIGKTTKQAQQDDRKGVIRYALSDRTFIDKGWTLLPTEKVVRKMNVYRMRPSHPEFDWFSHNKSKGLIQYDTGEKAAEFNDNGRGRWFYRNGRVALDYYDAEESNAQQRFVVYSSGEPDERGRARPLTILATFDYLGNGIVFDHSGKIRLKYNQTEGIVLDRSLGPVSHWKWHSLNDPPVLQQVMIDTHMSHKDPTIYSLGGPNEDKPRPDNEEMLAIEFDNFIKEKGKKLSQPFKPFQIRMKALKINENFSLKILDQASVYLIFRDGTTNFKLNLGMILDHKEIVDTDTAEVGEVSNSVERLPAKTESLAGVQKSVALAQKFARARLERDQRLRPVVPRGSADRLTMAASRPMAPPPIPARREHSPTTSVGAAGDGTRPCTSIYSSRKTSSCNLYYSNTLL